MASESKGTKGQPYFASTGAPAIDVDPGLVADYAALMGNYIVGTATQRTANVVPGTSVAVWEGLRWYDTTDKSLYLYTGSTYGWQLTPRHLEFTSTTPMVDTQVQYPQWTADTGNTIDPLGSTVAVWNNGTTTASGLQFNQLGLFAVNSTAALAVNVSSGTAVFQGSTGSNLEGVGTSGPGNQNLSFSIPNYRVTTVGQRLTILVVKVNGSPANNAFRVKIDKIG